jgi:hypothetical protein
MTRKQIIRLVKKYQLMPELYIFDEWVRRYSRGSKDAISYMEQYTNNNKRPINFVIGTLTLLKDTVEYSKKYN